MNLLPYISWPPPYVLCGAAVELQQRRRIRRMTLINTVTDGEASKCDVRHHAKSTNTRSRYLSTRKYTSTCTSTGSTYISLHVPVL